MRRSVDPYRADPAPSTPLTRTGQIVRLDDVPESDASYTTRATPSTRMSHRRTQAGITAIPHTRAARASQTYSPASTSRSFLAAKNKLPNKRLHIRPSLAGPQVEELTIERRAEMLADVAGDCLLKLLRAGLHLDENTRLDGQEWRRTWDGLQSAYAEHVPLFQQEAGLPATDRTYQLCGQPISFRSTHPPSLF